MIKIKLKKVYFTTHGITNMYVTTNERGEQISSTGVFEHLSEDQTFATLKTGEQIVVTIEKIPFIMFRIIPVLGVNYTLTSVSPISLKTYLELQDRRENWGEFDDIGRCVNKVISIVAGFVNRMGGEDFNDGNYYKD